MRNTTVKVQNICYGLENLSVCFCVKHMTYTQPQSKAFSSYAGERDIADHKKAALISNSCMYKTENALKIKTTGKKKIRT